MQLWDCWLSLGRMEDNLPAWALGINLLSTISRVLFTLPIISNVPPVYSVCFVYWSSFKCFSPKNFFWTKHLHQFHLVPVSATQPLDKIAWPEDVSSFHSSMAVLTRLAGPGKKLRLVVAWLLCLQIQGCSSRGWQLTALLSLELEDQRMPTLTSSFAWLTSPVGLP